MEENFTGYLLNALDPQTEREVEAYLRANPEANRQMDLVRQALEPLEADMPEIEPPPNLAARTLARVDELCCRDLPRAPVHAGRWSGGSQPRWWRRADVLVAAGIFLCVGLLVPQIVGYLRHEQQRVSCEENLGPKIGFGMMRYADLHHGAFPNVAAPDLKPRNYCGMWVVELLSSGVIDKDDFSIGCAGNGSSRQFPWTVAQIQGMSDEELKEKAPRLGGCYSFTMGHYDHGRIQGPTQDRFPVPLMADRPPFRADGHCTSPNNSPNHGGAGQNVLFTDGHVAFMTSRSFLGDDIYLNRAHQVAPGRDPSDIVLGVSEARATPLD
jgi:prepilin-type processing-associated H-X9-DG protein